MDLSLDNKNFVVSGSNSGIGLAIAEALLVEKANVCLHGRNREKTQNIKKSLDEQFKANISYFTADLSKHDAQVEVGKKMPTDFGPLDGIVCNAGSVFRNPALTEQEQMLQQIENNFFVAFNLINALLPFFSRRGGAIVLISSIVSQIDIEGAPFGYSIGKQSLDRYAKIQVKEMAKLGIRINVVSPGNILFEGGAWDTKLKADKQAVQRRIKHDVPFKRFGSVEEIAYPTVFLLSEKSSFVSGANLVVDGGQSSQR